jgi:signal transduction histidine kinase
MCDLRQVWQRACEDAAACAPEQRLEISTTASAGAAPDAAQTRCFADEVAVRQVFRNILENALDPELKSARNGQALCMRIDWDSVIWRDEPAVKVTISDNGPGLEEAAKERLFEPFFTTKARGTGLGLAICRRIVEAHGGAISAFNGKDRGLTLEIVLPKGPHTVGECN